jgi:hypothetical protein
MRQFLAQFNGILTGMGKYLMEEQLYKTAAAFIPGYNGGTWPSQKLGNVWAFVAPGTVRIVSPMNGADETLSAKAAGLALSILAVAHFFERHYEKMSEAQQNAMVGIIDRLKDAVPTFKGEASKIYNIID